MLELLEKAAKFGHKLYSEHLNEDRYVPPRISKLVGLPTEAKKFDPFLSSRTTDNPIWPREDDLQRFNDHMRNNQHSHTILVGSSGTGKSVFLRRIVKPNYPGSFFLMDRYNNFLSSFINMLPCNDHEKENRTDLATRISQHIKTATPQLIDKILTDRVIADDDGLNKLLEEAEQFITNCLRDRPLTLFVFDQIERFVEDFRYASTHNLRHRSANKIFCLIRLLKVLRQLPNARTIFAIRKDTLFDSIDFLSYSLDAPNDSDRIFRYMYFTGITLRNGQAVTRIMESFEAIDGDRSVYTWERIATFLSLSSRSLSNTFLTQLTGYMIEHFGETKEVKKIIEYGEPRDLLPIFFDQLSAGFHRCCPEISYDILRLVMLTIAIENRDTGDPISTLRAAGLAHIPVWHVDKVINYLKQIGVVRPDAAGNDLALRYAHDMLFDHIVESDSFTVRNDLHNVIERLAERRTPNERLTIIKKFGKVWSDAIADRQIGAIAVATFMTYGAFLILSSVGLSFEGYSLSPACNGLHAFWLEVWGARTYVDSCENLRWYYPLVYIMDCLWVSFIYKLDRGYFAYVLANRPSLRIVAECLPIIGIVLGIAMSFTPILTLVPLISVGILMALLLLLLGSHYDRDTIFSKANRAWGVRTLSNMLFCLLLILLHWFMVTNGPQYVAIRLTWDSALHRIFPSFVTAPNLAFWFTGVFFVWFLFHIRPEQQNILSLATRLAEFDAVSSASRVERTGNA